MIRPLILSVLSAALAVFPVVAEEPIDASLNAKIRQEGLERSHVQKILHMICDGHGPRLTASPNYKAAADSVIDLVRRWGIKDAKLETWDFKHPGWANSHLSVHATAPFRLPLHAEVVAWTPSTQGIEKGAVSRLVLPEEPLPGEFQASLAQLKGKVKGKVVMVGGLKDIPVLMKGYKPRQEEAELKKRFDPAEPPKPPRIDFDRGAPKRQGALRARDLDRLVDEFLVQEKALARVNNAGLRNGLIRAFANRTYDMAKAVPTVVMRAEDFGRLWRLMGDGKEAALELDIRNQTYPESTQGYNVVLEIPGSEKPEEVVMMGAHLDSWHTSTGATDNGSNCAVILEAMRIIKTLNLSPKRTLRVVLFDGEEQGLLGSTAYVARHYGNDQAPKAEFNQLTAFFNLDGGSGQIRGMSYFGPVEASQVLRELLTPYKDLGVVGAIDSRGRLPKPDYADVTVFTHAGLPGGTPSQDSLEYMENTWHTPIDSVERVPVEDMKRSAVVMASVVIHLANRAQPMPRFTKETLPPLPVMPASSEKK